MILHRQVEGDYDMDHIGAIILAAGLSKRMGQPKQLLPLGGKPLLRFSVEAAVTAGLKPVALVVGENGNELYKHIADLSDIEVVENIDYKSGMASSLKVGIQTLSGRANAVLVFLADQPFVPSMVIKEIVENYNLLRREGVRIVQPEYNGTLGHPILFDEDLFIEFENIQGDEGGKSIIKKNHSLLKIIPFENSDWGLDVDTPEDLLKLNKIAPNYINTT